MENILGCHKIIGKDFVRGENCHLFDKDGNKYIDLESGIWAAALGHSNQRINNVIISQIKNLVHLGTPFISPITKEAADNILKITGFENGKCVFLSSGSEAVEFSVQAIRKVSTKPLLITFSNSYLAAYGSSATKNTSEWYLYDWTLDSKKVINSFDSIPFEKLGGFIFEPGGSGAGFINFPPKDIVDKIADTVKQNGGFLAANEITTGMAKTGKWFGFQHYNFQPDIVAIGKGLGNGYPVSAVSIKHDLAEQLEKKGMHYVQSHQNDPLGCAIAKEVISIIRDENLIVRAQRIVKYFLNGLQNLKKKHNIIKDVRGRGMISGMELHPDKLFTSNDLYNLLLENGFITGNYTAGNLIRFDPALTIPESDIDSFLAGLSTILTRK